MKRRTYLASIGVGTAALGGVAALVRSSDESRPDYWDDGRVVYDRDDLSLRALEETVRLGETIEFEVTNTDESKVTLGCHNPWAIQRYADGRWRHVTWTGSRYYQMCASMLSPGESHVERIEMSESGLEAEANDVRIELRPGRHRFLLVGSSPFLATDFEVVASK